MPAASSLGPLKPVRAASPSPPAHLQAALAAGCQHLQAALALQTPCRLPARTAVKQHRPYKAGWGCKPAPLSAGTAFKQPWPATAGAGLPARTTFKQAWPCKPRFRPRCLQAALALQSRLACTAFKHCQKPVPAAALHVLPAPLSSSLGPSKLRARTALKQQLAIHSPCRIAASTAFKQPPKPVQAASPHRFQAALALQVRCELPSHTAFAASGLQRGGARTAFKQPWPSKAAAGCHRSVFKT